MKVKREEFGNLESGMIVKVQGERGIFEVQHIDTWPLDKNGIARPAEVTVVGGSSGHKAYRTFYAERLRPAHRRLQGQGRKII